jgi:hypothetical protein
MTSNSYHAPVLVGDEELVGSVGRDAGGGLAVDEVVGGDLAAVVAGAHDVEGGLVLRVVAQVEDVDLVGELLGDRVGQLVGLLGRGHLDRLGAGEDVGSLGGDAQLGALVGVVPAIDQVIRARVALEVVGEQDARVAADADVARVVGSDAVAAAAAARVGPVAGRAVGSGGGRTAATEQPQTRQGKAWPSSRRAPATQVHR